MHQLDGTFACLPVWMTDEAASRFEIGDEPRFPLDILRSLRNEVDALLGFLASESKTERPENGAPIREFPAKPIRGREAVRRAGRRSKERLATVIEVLLREIAVALARLAARVPPCLQARAEDIPARRVFQRRAGRWLTQFLTRA